MVICLEQDADLNMAQLMPLPLPLTVSCSSKIQIGFTFLVLAHLGSPGKGPLNGLLYVLIVTDTPPWQLSTARPDPTLTLTLSPNMFPLLFKQFAACSWKKRYST